MGRKEPLRDILFWIKVESLVAEPNLSYNFLTVDYSVQVVNLILQICVFKVKTIIVPTRLAARTIQTIPNAIATFLPTTFFSFTFGSLIFPTPSLPSVVAQI